ncbi:MAG: pyruvate, phosphate dikinase [Firmicutes bacterium]|mgnify:CR=1 FL=1|nr:pyruvate, phosphate dikinase [Bacillota bacterium]
MSDDKKVYMFGEGNAGMKKLLGGKGANLAEMTRLNLPVPPGFIVTTEACNDYYRQGETLSEALKMQVAEALRKLEKQTGKTLGNEDDPLLLSVRSGAYYSMPGMMDTILNLGLNDSTVEALSRHTGNRAFALDCYRRFLQMYGDVVLKIEHNDFERALETIVKKYKVRRSQELPVEGWERVIERYKQIIEKENGKIFPQSPHEQLINSVSAVFGSWNNPRAKVYRRLNGIPDDLGTAVNIQAMVFGNLGESSGTGVAFTRDPSTGEKRLYGEFLFDSQGEDVVAGIRTPLPITVLREKMPDIYTQFNSICDTLEKHYHDMQDIEFTIEKGKLYILQTRNGKRTAGAAVKIAVDMVAEGICTKEEALLRVDPSQLVQLLHQRIDHTADLTALAEGLPASPGAAAGRVVFDANMAEKKHQEGEKTILVRPETTPDDIHGIVAAQGVLTSRGGMTSHAAVVARGMGKPCISGCEAIRIDADAGFFQVNGQVIEEGEVISIDGTTGRVYYGEVPLVPPDLSPEFKLLLSWADSVRTLGVRANADTARDARKAKEFGAEGIGLCRTEHMFMEQERLPIVQEMILANTAKERNVALDQLLPIQQSDFEQLLREMEGLPTTIRLLDPPLHEFLPNLEELMVEVACTKERGEIGESLREKESLLKKVRNLTEFNPMLGHRGCRLGLVFPEIYRMQVRAICQAVVSLSKEGQKANPEIMIPLVGHPNELEKMREIVQDEIDKVAAENGMKMDYPIGTMIELPRACVAAGEIAAHADFFSFGTNDLTQTAFGFSRDDAEGKFLPFYIQQKILPDNPFMVLDREGVGKLMSLAVDGGRRAKSALKMGICGEHGGEPQSIEFCYQLGLDYVSCSPFRVAIARLAAAQAAINTRHK